MLSYIGTKLGFRDCVQLSASARLAVKVRDLKALKTKTAAFEKGGVAK